MEKEDAGTGRSKPAWSGFADEPGKVAFLFPAFAMQFAGSPAPYGAQADEYLSRASELVTIDRERFGQMTEGRIEDELQAHYFCYINSAAVSTTLKRLGTRCDYVAGYSMGLFAGLFHAECVSFEDGLMLMHDTYTAAISSIGPTKYGMGVIVGLGYDTVERLVAEHCANADIIDVSNAQVINVTGLYDEIVTLLGVAKSKAIATKMLPITLPYHSRFMRNAPELIHALLADLELKPPACPIVSCVNQKVLSSVPDVKEELYLNVSHKIHWFNTMQKLLALDTRLFVECGMSLSLSKLAKFIPGDFRFLTVKSLAPLFPEPLRRENP